MLSSRILRFKNLNNIIVQFSNLHLQNRVCSTPVSIPLPSIEHVPIGSNSWMWKRNEDINLPKSNSLNLNFELPNGLRTILPLVDPIQREEIEAPAQDDSIEKQAITMLVIRRKKMKRHKLRKLRKRMKYEWAKKRQRRELKKEKEFVSMLIQRCKKGEEFSAEEYVTEKLNKYKQVLLARSEMQAQRR
ncbi:unnamed protein product [Phyllotreta striolata]|uniref:Ribosomal protein mS38 C-terminal domain-containing protein n=1 Tax=Phyllotreta striolata TaxID=444603 RepID=A0A9N9XQG6_PHYSR|nr:unnamed protein product [Phyllotreta striolata]